MTEAELRRRAPRRAQVLDFIRSELAAERPFPSANEIGRHMGWRTQSGGLHVLETLWCDGFLDRVATSKSVRAKWRYSIRQREADAA